jgi:multidrug efflux pump subunit AcrB
VRDNTEIPVQAGTFLLTPEDVGGLVVGLHNGTPVYLEDVADLRQGPDQPEQYVWMGTGPEAGVKGISARGEFPAVTVAVAKKPGENAVQIARKVSKRVEQLKGIVIPDGVEVTLTRDYGATADDKAKTLIKKLVFATASVVLLVWLALGWRESLIVGAAVVITLTITLFASWAWGFTLNRVSLFALIFSIGILVDDAIVVVENIHRHVQMGGKSLREAIPIAVDEVGGPTILATFTVIAALLPMAFVSGLMGPYMSPIPINASAGMLISLIVAFVLTPWLTYKVIRNVVEKHGDNANSAPANPKLERFFGALIGPFLRGRKGIPMRFALGVVVLVLIVGSLSLVYFQFVVLKMLPFDNKSEFQVVVDMPEGTTVEHTARVLSELAARIAELPEVTDYQVYAGTAAPINFNGLVRQYYLREGANVGDIQVNLVDKKLRERKSHEIARAVRDALQPIARRLNANVKVVEVPPGPPVMSPLVAEVYGLDYQGQIRVARSVRAVFEGTADIVDVDDSVETPSRRIVVKVDRQRASELGVSQHSVAEAVSTALRGDDVGYLHGANVKYPIPIRLEFSAADKADLNAFHALQLPSASGALIPLVEIAEAEFKPRENAIYHKDLLPVVFVIADMAGDLDSPLYGMYEIAGALHEIDMEGDGPIDQYLISQPDNPYTYSMKWDGEWQITYDTFRDMGIAYSVGLVLIYLLVVAQFKSYLVPLIIMAPIPMTIIGVMPGHALTGAQFTATSMIGMIALAGIIVRNSILLVDFINQQVAEGIPFQEAVIRSGAVRAKPIVLTGLAAMLGAFFILDDPIFSGLAVSLIFGILVSTVLTLLVIPVMYYAARRRVLEPDSQ